MFCECVARFVGRINPAAAYPVSVASYSILNDRIKIYLLSIKCITYRIHIIEEFDQASLEVGNTESIKKREMCRFLMP